MMCETCSLYGGDEKDNAVRIITGHHPYCADFKIDKETFAVNLELVSKQIAERMLAAELPKIQAMYAPKPAKVVKEISEKRIQEKLYHYRINDKVVVPNAQFFCGENDLISVNYSGYVFEFEIKISKGDFKADFKKTVKHDRLERCYRHKIRKKYNSGEYMPYPNYFYYAAPDGLLDIADIPDYAGLITVSNLGAIEKIKKAPRLHTDKISEKELHDLFRKCFYRYWNLRLK